VDYNIQNDDSVIDLSRLVKVIIRRWRFVVIFAIIGTILTALPVLYGLLKATSGGEVKFPMEEVKNITPFYESTTLMEIRLPEENSEQAQAIVELATSNTVLKRVIDSMKLGIGIEEFRSLVSASGSLRNTITTLEIKVFNEEPDLAKRIADSVREHAKIFINNSMQIESFRIIQQGNLPNEPTSEVVFREADGKGNESEHGETGLTLGASLKNIIKRVVFGAMLGVFSSLFIIFIQFVLNDKIQTADDVERYLGKRVLASIPMYNKETVSKGQNYRGILPNMKGWRLWRK
jgi:capsular polysaccharide biosynthesis protein